MILITPKKIFAITSMTPATFSPSEPMREIAKPDRIETSSTCKRSPRASAPKNESVGMIASRCATIPCSFAWVT